jgi:hypothetical protein
MSKRLSDPNSPNSGDSDVLGSLPSMRPQRRSPKRGVQPAPANADGEATADGGSTGKGKGNTGAAKRRAPAARPAPRAGSAGKGAGRASGSRAGAGAGGRGATRARGPAAAAGQATPRKVAAQGYEPVSQHAPVQPPTGREILASAVQAAGEVAQLGLTISERLLRAAASRLPKP